MRAGRYRSARSARRHRVRLEPEEFRCAHAERCRLQIRLLSSDTIVACRSNQSAFASPHSRGRRQSRIYRRGRIRGAVVWSCAGSETLARCAGARGRAARREITGCVPGALDKNLWRRLERHRSIPCTLVSRRSQSTGGFVALLFYGTNSVTRSGCVRGSGKAHLDYERLLHADGRSGGSAGESG